LVSRADQINPVQDDALAVIDRIIGHFSMEPQPIENSIFRPTWTKGTSDWEFPSPRPFLRIGPWVHW
jgi:hypothetical protein